MFLLGEILGFTSAEDSIEKRDAPILRPLGHCLEEWTTDQRTSLPLNEPSESIIEVNHHVRVSFNRDHRLGRPFG